MQMQFDPEDTALIALVAFAASVMAGIGTFGAFDVQLSDTFSMAGGTFSLAYAATVGAFIVTILTNDLPTNPSDLRQRAEKELDQAYYLTLLVSLGVMVMWPFVPEIESFVNSQDLWGVLFIVGSVGAQIAIGYMK
jgi:hypothetical protein